MGGFEFPFRVSKKTEVPKTDGTKPGQPTPNEALEDQKWLEELTKKAIDAGALPDTSTPEDRIRAIMTQADSGRALADQFKLENDEMTAADNRLQTIAQKMANAQLTRQILVKSAKKKGLW